MQRLVLLCKTLCNNAYYITVCAKLFFLFMTFKYFIALIACLIQCHALLSITIQLSSTIFVVVA